jgi:hypothetical protein
MTLKGLKTKGDSHEHESDSKKLEEKRKENLLPDSLNLAELKGIGKDVFGDPVKYQKRLRKRLREEF